MCSEIFKSLNSIKSYKSILAICSNSGLSDKEKKIIEAINSKIRKFWIGWCLLEAGKKNPALSFFGGSITEIFLPSFLGGGIFFNHAFAFFEMENGSHARVEYGREGWGIDIDQNFEEFFKDCQPKYSFQHKPFLNPIELEISDNICIKEILDNHCKDYKGEKYNLMNNNCQTFINVFIKQLKAKRPKGKYGRGNHTEGTFGIPFKILWQLEMNENDVAANIVGYIPFLGTIIDSFR
jgi:hypothetical protein